MQGAKLSQFPDDIIPDDHSERDFFGGFFLIIHKPTLLALCVHQKKKIFDFPNKNKNKPHTHIILSSFPFSPSAQSFLEFQAPNMEEALAASPALQRWVADTEDFYSTGWGNPDFNSKTPPMLTPTPPLQPQQT
jgi:hypothetical protein